MATMTQRPRKVPAPEAAIKHVGTRLRAIRTEQRVTLTELAKRTRVDAATISRIETGLMVGTLESHLKLATALGAKLTDLYAGLDQARQGQAAVQEPSGRTDVYVHEAGKSSTTMLTTDVLKKKLMPVLVVIEPGGSTQREEARVGTERFIYVLEGEVEAKIGEATHRLKKGSTLYFDASAPHVFRNNTRKAVKLLSVMTPPAL